MDIQKFITASLVWTKKIPADITKWIPYFWRK